MKNALFLSALVLAGFASWGRAAIKPEPPVEPFTARELQQGYRDHVVLAKPRVARRPTVEAEEQREGMRVRRQWDRFGGLRILELRAGETPAEAIARLRATGRYDYVQPDTLRYAAAAPNDASFSRQWPLSNTGASNGLIGADIKAQSAWDLRRDAANVIVAVIDSGVRLDHPDLVANLWRNPREIPGNGRDDDGNGYVDDVHGINAITNSGNPADDLGHGTHVAGIIGAVGNNEIGISGVAWNVQIMALKFLRGSFGRGTTSDAIQCIDYAIANGAHIINASYGAASGEVSSFDPAEFDAIRHARDAGIIVVAAAGNEGADMDLLANYPASFRLDNVLAVGNSTSRDDLSPGTNYGSGAVELFAPGADIYSLWHDPNLPYAAQSGTSMAAPHVSGALALLKAEFPGDTHRQLINRVLRNVDAVPGLAGRSQTGGRLNLDRALRSTDSRPFNDDFGARARVRGNTFLIRSSNAGATSETEPVLAGHAALASLWWEWTAPSNGLVRISTDGSGYDTLVGVFTGSSLAGLAPVAANDDATGRVTSLVEFTAQAGTVYQIVVAGKGGATGLTLLDLAATPANDNFASGEIISGRSLLLEATNVQATLEPGEPQIRGRVGGKSLWYRWTAPATGRFQIGLQSDGFDPLLAVYTGTALNALALIGSSDDGDEEAGGTSIATGALVTFNAVAGTTYHIQADGNARSGQPPINARFVLTVNDSLWQGITAGAVTCAPTIGPDGAVYVGSTDGQFHAFNANGTRRWPALELVGAAQDTSAAALSSDGTLYFGTGPNALQVRSARLYAYNSVTGAKKWEILVGAGLNANNAVALAPDGTIYVHSDEGRLFAYTDNGTSVTQKWSAPVPGNSYAAASIARDGTLYLGCDDTSALNPVHRLIALNPADGSTKWSFPVDNPIYTSAAIDAAGNIYFGTLGSGRLYSVTPAGLQRWIYRGASLGTSSSPALSPDGRTVYFAGYDGKLHAVDATTGLVRWTFRLGNEVRASSPAVDATGVIYIGCYDGLVYAVNSDGTLKRTWATGSLIRSSPGIADRTLYIGSNDGRIYAFEIGSSAAGPWSQYRQDPRRTGRVSSDAFAVVTPPKSQAAVVGRELVLSVTVSGTGPFRYEWVKDGVVIPGATSATYTVPVVSTATAGTYAVIVSDPQGALTTPPAVIAVEAPNPGRLTNLSVRTNAGTADQTLTVGFVLAGAPDKTVLIRAIGPTLADFGVSGALSNPRLQLYAAEAVLMANDDWAQPNSGDAGPVAVAAAFAASGAFPLRTDSLDAAVLRPLGGGSYTAQITAGSGTGIALAEIYDTAPASGARLVNVSARAQVGTGSGILIAGFNVSGNIPKQILIRGVGPALSSFGVGGVLANPRLELYRGTSLLESNDDWGGTAALSDAFRSVGAFPLASGTSRDAALLATLPPGSYTAQVSGVGNGTGVALIEVYELP